MKFPWFNPANIRTQFVRLNVRTCQACWQCISRCHKHVIGKVDVLGHRHARIDNAEQCTGCLKCVAACSSNALTIIPSPLKAKG